MTHCFDINVATEYGMLEAIIISNFQYWITKNMANEVHFVDGPYWTYNSTAALCELFPYASKDQINRAINNLVERGVIIKGHFSNKPTDRTTWFAFCDEAKWISRTCEILIDTDNKHTNSKPNNTKENLKKKKTYSDNEAEVVSSMEYSDDFKAVLLSWLNYKREIKDQYKSAQSIMIMAKKLAEMSHGTIDIAKQIVEQSIANNWRGLFPLKENNVSETKGMIAIDPTIPDSQGYLPMRCENVIDGKPVVTYIYLH